MTLANTKFGAVLVILVLTCSCGGGGGSPSGGGGGGSANPLVITTPQILPATIVGRSYSATLAATGGTGQLHWSIAPVSSTALFVTGLAVDANSGVLSGTVNWNGTAGFVATVSDSASQTITRSFNITAFQPLTDITIGQTFTEFQSVTTGVPGGFGGDPPYTFTLASGNLPPGIQLASNLSLSGGATAAGTFHSTFTLHDSVSPPETATLTLNITVNPPQLTAAIWVANSNNLIVNHPVTGRVVASFGTPPYTFTNTGPALPSWLTLDSSTGQLSGIPTTPANFQISIGVADASSPPQHANGFAQLNVRAPLGRNDSVATATPLGNGYFSASISPYLDPAPTSAPGDNDYYKIIAVAGTTLHVQTYAKYFNQNNPLDTVIEILDSNGHQLSTCNQPGGATTNFTSACLNDDISATPHIQDSALDFMAQGTAPATATVYAHVFDWRGDARPDMIYNLSVSGAVDPLSAVVPSATLIFALGRPASAISFQSMGGLPPYSWSAPSASMPPGMTITAAGTLTGTPTAVGIYPVTFTLADSETPPQMATAPATLQVADPPHITTTSLPDGQSGVAYNQPISVGGGTPPYGLNFGQTFGFDGVGTQIQNGVPVVVGTPISPGSGTINIQVMDKLGLTDTVHLPLNITPGPLTTPAVSVTWKVGAFSDVGLFPKGGTPPYACTLQSGSVPPGTMLMTASGAAPGPCFIQGTPTTAGPYSATVSVTDSGSPPQNTTTNVAITVNP